jgi:hypothetical protein
MVYILHDIPINWEGCSGEENSDSEEMHTYICIGIKFIYHLENW